MITGAAAKVAVGVAAVAAIPSITVPLVVYKDKIFGSSREDNY